MTTIVCDLLPKQKTRKYNLKVDIDLYPCASELYNELNRNGNIKRTKEIPQLGLIRVPKRLKKTRYDYIMLQLYLHQLIKKNLQSQLFLTYNNEINAKEFASGYSYSSKDFKPTIGDVLQLLTIVYNIGHFYNTFTASRAIIMTSSDTIGFKDLIINASNNSRYKEVARKIINNKDYQKLHLLNSILILEKCNQNNQSVSLSLEILYSYINNEELNDNSKIQYIFSIFKNVRTMSYVAYDLQIAETPLIIDLCNKKAICLFLKELLSEYNNNQSSKNLIESVQKLLDDTIYNENSNAICYYKISRIMSNHLYKEKDWITNDYFNDLFIPKESILNRPYAQKRDYVQSNILKLTFTKEESNVSDSLLKKIEKTNNTRVGQYNRHYGEKTILVSIKNNCNYSSKVKAAYKTLKNVTSTLRKIDTIKSTDERYLLTLKFFLYYLFDENPVVIKPTINKEKCVICTRGKSNKIKELKIMIKESIGNEDENHEIQFMISQLKADLKNDVAILAPASILLYQKGSIGRKLCEFDGIIINPSRKKQQIVFLEAKNTSNKPSFGKNCLKEKLDKFPIVYSKDDIVVIGNDAYFRYSL